MNGLPPVTVPIDLPGDVAGADAAAHLATLCGAIKSKVQAQAGGRQPLAGFDCAPSADNKRIVMTSGDAGELSSVRVMPAGAKDASVRLKLGSANGGEEKDAVADLRPREMPDRGSLTGGVLVDADLTGVPAANLRGFQISLDGGLPDLVDIGSGPLAGANLADKLGDLAGRIQAAVQAIKPGNPAYAGFVAGVDSSKLVLSSGSRGVGSSVQVAAAAGDNLASRLKLLAGAMTVPGKAETLQGGDEQPLTNADLYNAFIASRADRKGIYALEAVDLFNLLCLPGVTDPGVLADADIYCQERRAFFIIDAPPVAKDPATMVATISGSSLPKSDRAAVYFPWIDIADPLNSGRLRRTAPCGTIAGLYARTDAARGVWKAPAGTDATLAGVQRLDVQPHRSRERRRSTRSASTASAQPAGLRTGRPGAPAPCAGRDQLASEWKYIPVRRMALYLEESLYRGTQWVVFEPNDEPLWAQIRLNVGAFMQGLFRQGAFQGKTPREAYLVKCDRETTTQNDINSGIVNIVVGFAPLKPAEFVIIQLQQLAGQVQA